MNPIQGFLMGQVKDLFPRWVPVELLTPLTELLIDAKLDGDQELTPQTRAVWQARFDQTLRLIGLDDSI